MKQVVVFLADGFEECEALFVVDILRRAGVEVLMVSVGDSLQVKSSRNILVRADALASDVCFQSADLLFLPGGRLGVENLLCNETVREWTSFFVKNRTIAAICAAPSILADIGVLEGKKATCHPDYRLLMRGAIVVDKPAVVDGNIITGKGLGSIFEFSFELVNILAGKDVSDRIKMAICY